MDNKLCLKDEAKRGFTLVELLTVVAIIAILLSILAPSTVRALELARRSTCATRLDGIGNALAMYAQSNNQRGPFVDPKGGHCDKRVGFPSRSYSPYAERRLHRSNSVNLWLLWYADYVDLDIYICPSAGHESEDDPIKSDGEKYSDFSGRKHLSYGYQLPYNSRASADGLGPGAWTTIMESGVAIAADMSPYVKSDGSWHSYSPTITGWGKNDLTDDEIEAGNSPNHDGEGQNVLYADGHVSWTERADVGIDNDNVYTAASGDDDTDQEGEMDVPNSEVDSMIAP